MSPMAAPKVKEEPSPEAVAAVPKWQHVALDKFSAPFEFRVERLFHPRLARLCCYSPSSRISGRQRRIDL